LNNEAGALTELGGINLSTPRRRILLHAHAHSLSSMGCLPPAVGRQRGERSRHRVPPVSLLQIRSSSSSSAADPQTHSLPDPQQIRVGRRSHRRLSIKQSGAAAAASTSNARPARLPGSYVE